MALYLRYIEHLSKTLHLIIQRIQYATVQKLHELHCIHMFIYNK